MKFVVFCFGICALVTGCRDKKANIPSPAPDTGESAGAEPAGSKYAFAARASAATPEQVASTLRVRVKVGGLASKSYVGALLHREEVGSVPGLQGKSRCVLALLSGWSESQLRDPQSIIFIHRNQLNAQGELQEMSYPARVLQFDQQSGLAALGYTEKFSSTLDAGYRIVRESSSGDAAQLVRTWSGSDSSFGVARSRMPRALPPIQFETGVFVTKDGLHGAGQFSRAASEAVPDDSPALVSHPDRLIGFLRPLEKQHAAVLLPVSRFELDLKVPLIELVGIGFGKVQGAKVPISIATKPADGASQPSFLSLRVLSLPPGTTPGEATRATREPIDTERVLNLVPGNSQGWRSNLPAPPAEAGEAVYLLQLGWPAFPESSEPSVFSRPVVVKLRQDKEGVISTVEGAQNLNEAAGTPQGVTASFPLEAAVSDLHEMAGGREVLFRMEGAPYWKRFSLTRNEWLPLPEINLSNAHLTGNLTALYVLDRGAAELRKYSLVDLRLLQTAKLPTGREYVAALAGCNTERGPVHVLAKDEVIVLTPDTLERQDYAFAAHPRKRRHEFKFWPEDSFDASGDGLTFGRYQSRGWAGDNYRYFHSQTLGVVRQLYDVATSAETEFGSGVAGAYSMTGHRWLITVATPTGEQIITAEPTGTKPSVRWLVPNAPVILRYTPSDDRAIPAQAARIKCFSYFDSTHFATIETPELSGEFANLSLLQNDRWTVFDPYSLRLGVLARDRKKWVVHSILPVGDRNQPVLINWPETSLSRGGEFRFKPLLLGGANFSAEVLGLKTPAAMHVAEGEISLSLAGDELASLFLLNLKVPSKNSGLAYAIPLHLIGPDLPLVAPAAALPDQINSFAAGFKTLAAPKENVRALHSTVHTFSEPVRQVLGPVAGHLILVRDSQQVDFFSLETRKIARTIPSPQKASYYTGAGALFEYDSTTRTLARITVPDARRERTMTLPNGLRMHALAIGTHAASPLTLVVEKIQGQAAEHWGGLSLTLTQFDRGIVVLNSHTLQTGSWAQPILWQEPRQQALAGNPLNVGSLTERPYPLPCSHSGQFVTFSHIFLALGRGRSVAAPFPDNAVLLALHHGLYPPSGSISGMRVANSAGTIFNGGISDEFNMKNPGAAHVTPCGRYRLVDISGSSEGGDALEVRTVENNRELFRLGRLAIYRRDFDGINEQVRRRVTVLGNNGPLVVLAGNGRLLQVVDFDIPRLALELKRTEFHVTSQPAPCVVAGSTLEYQIEVNNPEAVPTFRLRNPTSGVTLTPRGRLHYSAAQVTKPTRVQISTEIESKDGQTILHEFVIFVLPAAQSNAPPAPTRFQPHKTI